MMSGSRGSEAGVLEGLMTLVSDPAAFSAKLAELKDAQAQLGEARAALAEQRAELDARAEALSRKDDELCKLVTEIGDAERALVEREKAATKREADIDAKLAKLEAGRVERDAKAAALKAEIAAERKALKQTADMNAAMENGLNVRAAMLDEREAVLVVAEAAAKTAAKDYKAKLKALKSLVA
ncbi:hypothetical protein ACFFTN_01390 [Aminobacter aganoensis]|uniref:Chromosome segregation ATPase n=1 Tax=Aminobacter aganoensis TaxID=83264 RepID=A0A7X0KJX0_9HYPH|nr:hypothetical protein [Aminobacter aganoensis]MBB6353487.1 chromosome segregation ATPase [Aminobacter aganoensis]